MEADVVAESDAYGDDEGLAWYVAAAAGDSEEEEEEDGQAQEAEDHKEAVTEVDVSSDPYLMSDPYLEAEAVSDPYGDIGIDDAGQELATASAADPVTAQTAASAIDLTAEHTTTAPQKRLLPPDLVAGAPHKIQKTEPQAQTKPLIPQSRMEAAPKAQSKAELALEPKVQAAEIEPDEEMVELTVDHAEILEPVPERERIEVDEVLFDDHEEGSSSWDARVLVVRRGQIHIELQNRNPPMKDSSLLSFCDWLDTQLPIVVANFPYVRRKGSYVDLSDNGIGPEGLDKLFRVLRDHRVPCIVMKAYRNLLDDSIVDTLIEYLYTQPESHPMHGIHISHNNISDKGAFRLIRAAAMCGHYPRYTSRLPLWLRLESNDIQSPFKLIADCNAENFNVCLMKDGMCSRPTCNHYSGVHVQLPYFFHQGSSHKGPMERQNPIDHTPPPIATPSMPAKKIKDAEEMLSIFRGGADEDKDKTPQGVPDWMKTELPRVPNADLMLPAPKRQMMMPAPKKQAMTPPEPLGMQRVVRPPMPAAAQPPDEPLPFSLVPKASGIPPDQNGSEGADEEVDWGGDENPQPAIPQAPSMGNRGGHGGGCKGGGFADWRPKGASKGPRPWGNANGGGFAKGGKGKGNGGKPWSSGGGGTSSWRGPSLVVKVTIAKDLKLAEGESHIGFTWTFVSEGKTPRVLSVDPYSTVGQIAHAGDCLLRVSGFDTGMFNEKQITDMLKQRPISLRFGTE